MGKKDKKKGKGAEKTAMKTEKKALSKMKKNLAAIGEDNLELLISQCQAKNKKSFFGEELCTQPSPRSGFTLCAHPDRDELLFFGGEYFNGSETTMFDDLYFYNIRKNQWAVLQTPTKPPPRCSHQAVVVAQSGGQMWVFGGEFASPSRSSFYHYRDLWAFHFVDKRWEQVKALGGPTARSGHRMVGLKKQIILFGGFFESLRDYRYFDDAYIFSLESYTWSKIEVTGKSPSPRSGFLMAPVSDGRILVYGGYSREKLKKDADKGITYTDMYYLHLDERVTPPKWKWVQAKPSGMPPSPRSGMSVAVAANDVAYCFGGVHDRVDDEESLMGVFHGDLLTLDLGSGRWSPAPLRSKTLVKKRRRRVKANGEVEEEMELDDSEEVVDALQKTTLSTNTEPAETSPGDSVFTVTLGPSTSAHSSGPSTSPQGAPPGDVFTPPARMSAAAVVKSGIFYLYGGLLEEGDRRLTLSDFYCLDIHKLEEWRTIVPFSLDHLEWIDSGESDDESDQEMGEESESSQSSSEDSL